MKEIRRNSKIFNWLFSRTLGSLLLAVFNIMIATIFVSFFFSIGVNLYRNMVKQYNVTSEYEQLDVFVSDDVSEEEKKILTDDVKKFCMCYDTEEINRGKENSIGIFEASDAFFLEDTYEENFLAFDEEKLSNGVIISDNYRNKIGMKLEEIGKRKIKIQKADGEIELSVVAVLNSDLDSIWTNFYCNDIYISKELFGVSDNLSLQIITVQVNDSIEYKEKIKDINCFIVNEKEEENQYIHIAKVIRGIVMVFGILFAVLAALGVINVNRNLLNKNFNKIYLMMSMGFPIVLIKRAFYYMGLFIGTLGSVIGFFLLNGIFIYFTHKYQEQKFYNIKLADLMCVDDKIIILSFLVIELITLLYMYISLHKVTNEIVICGLAEME